MTDLELIQFTRKLGSTEINIHVCRYYYTRTLPLADRRAILDIIRKLEITEILS